VIFSCNLESLSLAFFQLLEPFTFLLILLDSAFSFLREVLRNLGFSNFSPLERIAESFIPRSTPIVDFSLNSCFSGTSLPLSIKIEMKYFPVGVLEIVAVFGVPSNVLEITILTFPILGSLINCFSKSTV